MVQASASAAGLGFSNGRIPAAFLASVGNGQVMEPHAAAQLNAALADMHAHGFPDVYVLEGYRSYDTQVQLRDGYLAGRPGFNVAAIPGTSNHGDGRAADLAGDGMDEWDSAAQAYWQSIEAAYGYSSAQGRSDGEAWHKVCTTWLDNITNTITPKRAVDEETEMFYKAKDAAGGIIGAGWTYKQFGNGPMVPITNLESVALSAAGTPVAEYDGNDVLLLCAVYGLAEYQVLPDGNTIWGGKQLLGPGKLTGRIIYPGSPLREYPPVQLAK